MSPSLSLLQLLERQPLALFAEHHLLANCPEDFETFRSHGLLELAEPSGALMFSRGDSVYMAVRDGDRLLGIEIGEDDPEVVEADEAELRRWKADLMALAAHIQRVSAFTGSPARITDRLWFLGEDGSSAVLLALYADQEQLEAEAFSLPQRFPSGSRQYALACPSLEVRPTIARRLEDAGMTVIRFGTTPFSLPGVRRRVQPGQDWHTDDYRSVSYQGRWRALSTNQARVVELFDQIGQPLTEARLQELLDIKSNIYQIFRGSWAQGVLIVAAGGKGLYRLESPENH